MLQRLKPLHDLESVRWHDLMWFVLSWAMRRRPAKERQSLRTVIEQSQPEPKRRQEVMAMSQLTDKTWEEECLEREAEREAKGELRAHQAILRRLLQQRFQTEPPALA